MGIKYLFMEADRAIFPAWCRIVESEGKFGLSTPEGKEIAPAVFDEVIRSNDNGVFLRYRSVEFGVFRDRTINILNSMYPFRESSLAETLEEKDDHPAIPRTYFNVDKQFGYRLSVTLDEEDDLEMIPVCAGVSVSSHWAKVRGIIPWTERDILCQKVDSELRDMLRARYPKLTYQDAVQVAYENEKEA